MCSILLFYKIQKMFLLKKFGVRIEQENSKGGINMTNAVFIAGMVTFLIFVTVESLRRDFLFKNIKIINEELRQFISEYLGEAKRFDIFMVRNLRQRIMEDFALKEGLETFELSMIDSSTLKIIYEIDGEIEEINVTTDLGKVEIKEAPFLNEADYY